PNALVQLTVQNNNTTWGSAYGTTDNLGNVSGLVPVGVNISMNLFSHLYVCNTPFYTQTIGPFTTNSALTITAIVSPSQLFSISGTATDCSGSPIQSGTAFIYTGQYGYYYASIVNGAYTITAMNCSAFNEIDVTVVDYANSLQGSSGLLAVSGNTITV